MQRKYIFAILLLTVCLLCSACVGESYESLPVLDSTPTQELPQQQALQERLKEALNEAPVLDAAHDSLRKFPYPYLAMLAISSDCDSATQETFERMHQFLNTREESAYGPGLGLDIADTFFVYNGSNSAAAYNLFCYCAGTDPATPRHAELIRKYYDCGWIDAIHAFGDFSHNRETLFTRELAQAAWDLLDQAGIAPTVWIDHGNTANVQNFGSYSLFKSSRYQAGDNPYSLYYHTDLTLGGSVRYIWHSRHSDQFGHDFPLTTCKLRDGQKVWRFSRYTSEMKGKEIDWLWRPPRLPEQITAAKLDALEQAGQYAVIAQHLTVYQDDAQISAEGIAALRLLAERHHEQRTILVARTSRLLDYAVAQKYLRYQLVELEGYTAIRILAIADPVTGSRAPREDELRGLTFYVADPAKTVVYCDTTLLSAAEISQNPADDSGRLSISIPWYEEDTTDYTQTK